MLLQTLIDCSVQFSSVAQSCPTLCDPMNHSTPGLPVHHQLPEFTRLTSIESVMPSCHPILCGPFLLLPPIPPSIRVFSNELALHIRWPKYWSFSINPSNEYSGLISFKIGWFDLLSIRETPKSLLQHHSSKASILRHSIFLKKSHPYVTTGKTTALTIQTFRRRQWHPTPVLLPGKSHGWRGLVGCSPWGR